MILTELLLSRSAVDFDTRRHEAGISVDGIRDWDEHAARRKPWSRAMNGPAVNAYMDPMRGKIDELLDVFSKHQGETVDMAFWMTLFGYVISIYQRYDLSDNYA